MNDLLIRIAVSNLLIAGALALAAWFVGRTGKHPGVAHLLWLVVLVKLVTPPVITLPVLSLPGTAATRTTAALVPPDRAGLEVVAVAALPATDAVAPASATSSPVTWTTVLLVLWLLGSALLVVWSLVRVVRFHRRLGRASAVASPALQHVASGIAGRLGLRTTPTVYGTSARVTPLVWWVGGRVRVVLPAELLRDLDAEQVYGILAHELAHVRRGDHRVRWLEWLACVLCWWNPVAWWARSNLRRSEEVCTDALVLSALNPPPRTYASSLLAVVEFLSAPALRPPAMASGIDGGGFLERRLKMIVLAKPLLPTPRWLRGALLLGVLAVLPLGIAQAGEPDYEAVADRLVDAVQAGELTADQAEAMMGELARARFAERTADARGRDRLPPELMALRKKLGAAVRAGKLSQADAKAKLEAYARKLRSGRRDGRTGHEEGLEGHFQGLGVDAEAVAGIRKRLVAGGLSGEKAEQALGGLLRVIHQMKEQGEDFEPDARMETYFREEVGLSDEQMEEGLGIARRIVHGLKRGDGTTRGMLAKVKRDIWAEVKAGKITEEDAQKRWKGYLQRVRGALLTSWDAKDVGSRIFAEAGSAWRAAYRRPLLASLDFDWFASYAGRRLVTPELMAKVRADLDAAVEAGRLSEADAERRWAAYLEHVRGGASKADEGRDWMEEFLKDIDRDIPKGRDHTPTRKEMAKVKAELDAAVGAGRLSEADAQKRWEEYLERVRAGEAREPRGERPTPEEIAKVKKRIWAAVEAGRVTEEQARARFEAYLKSLESRPR